MNARVAAMVVAAVSGLAAAAGGAQPGHDPGAPPVPPRDGRHILAGLPIPDEGYCDQPYVVLTREGHWLCTLTTGPAREGAGGQHVVSTISTDQGRTWSALVDIEPSAGPAASWVVPLVAPAGRVYAFYTYNGDRVSTLRGKRVRDDMLGWYCYRFSDDSGRSWSKDRYRLPMRLTACDRGNDFGGRVAIFWGICKPQVAEDKVYLAFTKLGRYMLEQGEGWLYCSDNVLHERDPAKIHWDMRPTGDHGIRAEAFGSVQEEHNLVWLGGERLYCVYRTTQGFPCHTYSSDGGRTWLPPEPMTYQPGGKRVKGNRACPKLWRCANSKFLFWFHNHGGKSYDDRNPAWICGGVERDGRIRWSQPEILLYDTDALTRMSYPDLIEQDGRYWVTETQKSVARVHEIDRSLLEAVWNQEKNKTVAREGLALDTDGAALAAGPAALSAPLDLGHTGGTSLDLDLRLESLEPGQVVVDSRDASGRGFVLRTAEAGTLRLELSDGTTKAAWDCDPGLLRAGSPHHVTAIVEAGPRLILFVIDGVLCDGGSARQFGWGRYSDSLGDVSGSGKLRLGPGLKGQVGRLRVYQRALRVSEAVGNFRASQDRLSE